MKIDNQNQKIGMKIYEKQQTNQREEAIKEKTSPQSKDAFTMSNDAKEIQKYLEQIKSVEVSREEKILLLKDKIQSGEYRIDPELLAQKILATEEE